MSEESRTRIQRLPEPVRIAITGVFTFLFGFVLLTFDGWYSYDLALRVWGSIVLVVIGIPLTGSTVQYLLTDESKEVTSGER